MKMRTGIEMEAEAAAFWLLLLLGLLYIRLVCLLFCIGDRSARPRESPLPYHSIPVEEEGDKDFEVLDAYF